MTEYPVFTAVRSRRRNKTNCQTTCKSKSRSQVRDTSCNTSVLLALRGDEPRGGPSRNASFSGGKNQCRLLASFMSRMEVLYIVWREEGEEEARHALRLMNSFTIEWISCEPNILEIAARLGTFRNTNLVSITLPSASCKKRHDRSERQLPCISGHFDISVSANRFALKVTTDLHRAFPVRHPGAAVGDQLLIGKCR